MFIYNDVFMLEATRKSIPYKGSNISSMVYAIVGSEFITLIDSGFPPYSKEIIEELKSIDDSKPLKQILLTHADADHMGNAYEIQKLTGCEVYAAAEEFAYIQNDKKRFGAKQQIYDDFNVNTPVVTVYPSQRLGDFTIISTPGHTSGHVAILYKDILFPGDLCSFVGGVFRGPNPLYTENMEQAEESLNNLRKYSFATVCPAHGLPFERNDLI